MNTEINKTKWKCRRGLRELDLLFRKFSNNHLESLSKQDFDMFNSILDFNIKRKNSDGGSVSLAIAHSHAEYPLLDTAPALDFLTNTVHVFTR